MATIIIRTPEEMRAWRQVQAEKSVGFVPTMGALHPGHEALLKRARSENELCVLSIFINPTQFNDKKDLQNYPQTWDQDLHIAKQNKVDVIFAPGFDQMYPDQFRFKLIETDFSKQLCGTNRPGHFDGVLSIVLKLFNIIQPARAYFGEKDFQQLTLIRDMVQSFFLNIEIIAVPTLREKEGLAMSSRNNRLSAEDRARAAMIYKIISTSPTTSDALQAIESLNFQNWKVDYITDMKDRRFIAVRIGEVRLIDNVPL